MNKKILRGVPKKTAEIPKSEERIRLDERQKFADKLIDGIQHEYGKSLEAHMCALANNNSGIEQYYNTKLEVLEWVMRMICGKVYEK